MPPRPRNNTLCKFNRPCWNAHERGPPMSPPTNRIFVSLRPLPSHIIQIYLYKYRIIPRCHPCLSLSDPNRYHHKW
jgi:hypothetical protein